MCVYGQSLASVHDSPALINQTLDEILAEQEGEFDSDTRRALAWPEQYKFDNGDFEGSQNTFQGKEHKCTRYGESGNTKVKHRQGVTFFCLVIYQKTGIQKK